MFLVTGTTGSLGRRVVGVLTARQGPVKAFVRLSADYSELENRRVEIFIYRRLETGPGYTKSL